MKFNKCDFQDLVKEEIAYQFRASYFNMAADLLKKRIKYVEDNLIKSLANLPEPYKQYEEGLRRRGLLGIAYIDGVFYTDDSGARDTVISGDQFVFEFVFRDSFEDWLHETIQNSDVIDLDDFHYDVTDHLNTVNIVMGVALRVEDGQITKNLL